MSHITCVCGCCRRSIPQHLSTRRRRRVGRDGGGATTSSGFYKRLPRCRVRRALRRRSPGAAAPHLHCCQGVGGEDTPITCTRDFIFHLVLKIKVNAARSHGDRGPWPPCHLTGNVKTPRGLRAALRMITAGRAAACQVRISPG